MVHHNGTGGLVVAGRQAVIGDEAADDGVHLHTTRQQYHLSQWPDCLPGVVQTIGLDSAPHLALSKLKHVAQLRNAEGGVEAAIRQQVGA